MTISTAKSRNVKVGNGISKTFALDFVFYEAEDLVVTVLDTSDDSQTIAALGTDYTVSGGDGETGSVIFITAPTINQTIVIAREMELTQPTKYGAGSKLPGPTFERSLDRLTLLGQQVRTAFNLSVKVSTFEAPEDNIPAYSLPVPVDGSVLVGNSAETGWVNATFGTLAGSPVTLPLSLTLGGTGATTQGTARTALGLGTAATYDAGTASGELPVLITGGFLDPARLPLVDGTNSGALPTFGSTIDGIYVSGTGWTDAWESHTPLDEVEVTETAVTSIEVAASGTEWDEFEYFYAELVNCYNAGSADHVVVSMNLSGTWRETSEYVYSAFSASHSGSGTVGASSGGKTNFFQLDTGTDNLGYAAAGAMTCRFNVWNGYAIDTAYSATVDWECSLNRDVGTPITGMGSARNGANLGFFRGLRVKLFDADGEFAVGTRLRIYGVKRHGAF